MSGPALVACDSFKGTFGAAEVTAAIARGLRAGGREACELPVADGGEGTMEVLVAALGGEIRAATVSDPLGRPVRAAFALLSDGATAVVECAQASGLGLVAEQERDPVPRAVRGSHPRLVKRRRGDDAHRARAARACPGVRSAPRAPGHPARTSAWRAREGASW